MRKERIIFLAYYLFVCIIYRYSQRIRCQCFSQSSFSYNRVERIKFWKDRTYINGQNWVFPVLRVPRNSSFAEFSPEDMLHTAVNTNGEHLALIYVICPSKPQGTGEKSCSLTWAFSLGLFAARIYWICQHIYMTCVTSLFLWPTSRQGNAIW